jgi:bacterioferritin
MAMRQWPENLEQSAIKLYNEFALECSANADSASKKLFEDLVLDKDRH